MGRNLRKLIKESIEKVKEMPSKFDLRLTAIESACSDYKESFAGYSLFVAASWELSDQDGVDKIDDIEE